MTAFLPLEAATPLPPSPAFLVPSPDPASHMKRVVKAILKARRIAVVCGAGISVQAGIPDFRSSEGLFQSLKKDHPTLSSGKDLFDASVFNSEDTTSLFCQMIAQLSQLSDAAQPTAFHRFLRILDERRRLLRVYTQNIDALEEKSGLTFGVPELDVKRSKPRSTKGKAATAEPSAPAPEEPSTSRLPSPPVETPRCIPLHGTLQFMHCQTCTHSFPLRDYVDSLNTGTPPACPQCTAMEETRQLVGKRSRAVGRLRPSVVLYNEDHKDGEEVGNVVRKDLMGSSKGKGRAGADLLLVVGTSLRVPGTKRIVREFSKAVRSRHAAMNTPADEPSTSAHGLVTPTPSPRRSPVEDEEPPVRTIYLNLDFPVPTREWDGVFDVWIRGDAQTFARMVQEELEREEQAKEAAEERRRKRKEAAAETARQAEEQERLAEQRSSQDVGGKKGKKRKSENGDAHAQPVKKRKTGAPPLSPVSPSKKPRKAGAKDKEKNKSRKREDTTLPTPPVSKDDPSKRLVIKVPARAKPVPEVVITTTPSNVRDCGPLSSPLSSPPMSTCLSPPALSKTASTMTPLSSPLSSPPHSTCAESVYDLSHISTTLSQISSPLSSPPASIGVPSPPKPSRTISATTLSPLSSPPDSPYFEEQQPAFRRQELSPSPSPSPSKRRRVSGGVGQFLGARPGTGKASVKFPQYSLGLHQHADLSGSSDEGEDAPRGDPESRYPMSYVRSQTPPIDHRRAGHCR
ncbi:DHS-like NAD/FAD-binding domain-containing protein [Lentinus tigrinus ALCF2SS1-7]|uniref:DHS-like NAD/FAD-binding domain-containing protein n=1 Tax=Lentinus tigrinus ALCF2SS1-6 TaxID=1328759 RepID=A0A5C2SBL2_9APHY|nr:DHS-like NAD/FAD-binding domain-containing protein [Lentinus tigrinus ALCF2SS1-6]RPD75231.1 DHS-like NAD/FAD-binding domain-containing protein [Lentinus tigrinus ALCF2SS1-7]